MISTSHQRTNLFFLGAILLLILSGVWVYSLYQSAYEKNAEIIATYQTIRAANRVLLSIDQGTMDVSAFLISKNEDYIKKIPEIIISAKLNIETLQQLIQDNPAEVDIFNKLKPMFDSKVEFLQKIVAAYSSGNQSTIFQLANTKERFELVNDIHQILIFIKQYENGQLEQGTPIYLQEKYQADKFFIILGVLNILLFLIIFYFFQKE